MILPKSAFTEGFQKQDTDRYMFVLPYNHHSLEAPTLKLGHCQLYHIQLTEALGSRMEYVDAVQNILSQSVFIVDCFTNIYIYSAGVKKRTLDTCYVLTSDS